MEKRYIVHKAKNVKSRTKEERRGEPGEQEPYWNKYKYSDPVRWNMHWFASMHKQGFINKKQAISLFKKYLRDRGYRV